MLLWPSAILMLGAQTYHGGIVLFLLSSCLNAGYFVLATMLLVMVIRRFNFAACPLKAPPLPRNSPIGRYQKICVEQDPSHETSLSRA